MIIFVNHLWNLNTLAHSAIRTQYYHINNFVLFAGVRRKINFIKQDDVIRYLQYLKNEKKYSSALKCYTKSLSYSIPAKKYKFSANSLGNIGTIYRDMDETEKSLNYYLKSIEQGKLGAIPGLWTAYGLQAILLVILVRQPRFKRR